MRSCRPIEVAGQGDDDPHAGFDGGVERVEQGGRSEVRGHVVSDVAAAMRVLARPGTGALATTRSVGRLIASP